MRHHTVRVYAAGVGWFSRCRGCGWASAPGPEVVEARAAGRVHEQYPEGVDWSVPYSWLRPLR